MEAIEQWTFAKLLTEYMAHDIFFERDCALKELPWSLQIEVKRIVAVLNAFTGGNYEAESKDGKRKINEAFSEGFQFSDNRCSVEQLSQLRELFPVIEDMFDEFEVYEEGRPRICEFYRHLFALYHASYKYVTAFDDLRKNMYTDAFLVFDAFKRKKINTYIIDQVKTIYKAFKILLGEMLSQKYSTPELVDKYGYPHETDEQLEGYDRKWSRYYGYNYRDFIKPLNYIDRFNPALSKIPKKSEVN